VTYGIITGRKGVTIHSVLLRGCLKEARVLQNSDILLWNNIYVTRMSPDGDHVTLSMTQALARRGMTDDNTMRTPCSKGMVVLAKGLDHRSYRETQRLRMKISGSQLVRVSDQRLE
jgi:hypothetical protein